jgi:hypothetical protein
MHPLGSENAPSLFCVHQSDAMRHLMHKKPTKAEAGPQNQNPDPTFPPRCWFRL